jgi:transposase-like protein
MHHIDCSDQPLYLSFHPTRNHIVAAALVDGTVEVHDFDKQVITAKAVGDQDQRKKRGTLLQRNNNDEYSRSYANSSIQTHRRWHEKGQPVVEPINPPIELLCLQGFTRLQMGLETYRI